MTQEHMQTLEVEGSDRIDINPDQSQQGRFRLPDPPEFSELKPLGRSPERATPFPAADMGTILGGAVKSSAQVVQVPEALAGNSFLAAAALLVQPHININIDGRIHPACEFFATIAASGDRKDATDNLALGPVYDHQRLLQQRFQEESRRFRNESAAFDKARQLAMTAKKDQQDNANPEMLRQSLEALGDGPTAPLAVAKVFTDLTIEGLTKYLVDGQPSVAIIATEGGQILGGHGFSRENMLKTASGLSKLWDGKPVCRVTVGHGTTVLNDRRVSMHLMIQPIVAPLLVGSDLLAGQGTLSRILLTCPESLAGTRLSIGDDVPINLTVDAQELQRYRQQAKILLDLPEPIRPSTRNELMPREVRLSQSALRTWRAFYNDTERRQGKDSDLCEVRGLASKIAEHAARLAGIIAFFDDVEITEIGSAALDGGIALAKHYLQEALRLHGTGKTDERLQNAQALYSWLNASGKSNVTLVEIYQRGPKCLRDARTARELVNILIEHGFMAPMAEGLVFDGAKRSEAFRVRLSEQP